MTNLRSWTTNGTIEYPLDHLTNLDFLPLSPQAQKLGETLAEDILRSKRILGQMDPGCMGMLNAVMSPDMLARIGMPLECCRVGPTCSQKWPLSRLRKLIALSPGFASKGYHSTGGRTKPGSLNGRSWSR